VNDYKSNIKITSGNVNFNNTELDISIVMQNDDDDTETGTFQLGYYLSLDNMISTGDFQIGEDTILNLAPGIFTSEDIIVDVSLVQPEIPGGTYYIGAFADKDFEVGELSEVDNRFTLTGQVTIPGIPGVPQDVQASDGIYGAKVVITWNPPTNPESTVFYRIFRNTTNDPNTADTLGIVWNSITTYWDSAAKGIDYYYWVKAAYNYLGLRASPFSTYDMGYQFIDPPENVQATDGEFDNRIVITWDPAPNATHYKVYRNTTMDPNSSSSLSSTWTSNLSFSDYTATQGDYYWYWVKSAQSSGGLKASPGYGDPDVGWQSFNDPPVVDATDGLYTDRVEVSWNSIPGAPYYKLYRSYTDDPSTSTGITAWVTSTNYSDGSMQRGRMVYYWVKAAVYITGNMSTGYGPMDEGWRKLETVQNVQAADGTSTDHIEVTWNNQTWANYFQLYRGDNGIISQSSPVTDWVDITSFNDSTAPTPGTQFYWVRCSYYQDGTAPSDYSVYTTGWRKLIRPEIEVTKGVYSNKIRVTWDPVPGANSYRVYRSELAWITDTMTVWSSTLNFKYDDYNVTQGLYYNYWVQAAYNNYGYRPSEMSGQRWGFADECGNLADDPNQHDYDFHGVTLEISHRVINNGAWPIQNPSEISYVLHDMPLYGQWDYSLGHKTIPPIPVGGYQDVTFEVRIDTIQYGPVPYGTYAIGYSLNISMANCENNQYDNYIVWETQPFTYNDALYGTYTIGGTNPDYPSFSMANTDMINKGVSDDVIFNVRPGTYYEQLNLGDIIGSDPTRTITFQSEPSKGDTAEIYHAEEENNCVIGFYGAHDIIIKNLKITSPGYTNYQSTYGRAISIQNICSNISILNNRITGTTSSSFVNDDNAVIYTDNSPHSGITISNNIIANGSTSIRFNGEGPLGMVSGTLIENNNIHNYLSTGISMKYHDDVGINNNIINYAGSGPIQCYGLKLENIKDFMIDKNRIIMPPSSFVSSGITLLNCNQGTTERGQVSNNFIAMITDGIAGYGIQSFNCYKTDIYFNSINITGTTTQDFFGIQLDCAAGTKSAFDNYLINNIVSNQTGGYAINYGDNAITETYLTTCDHNDLFTTGSYVGLYGNTTQIADLTAWQTASGFDSNSRSVDPEFISDIDLHTFSVNLNEMATPLPQITKDIDGMNRDPVNPDIGADEYHLPPPNYDAGVADITAPVTSEFLTDQESVSIIVENFGSQPISSFPVSYTINGGPTVTETIPGPIPGLDQYFYTFNTLVDLSVVGTYEIVAYTSLPGDERPNNDDFTLIVEHLPPSYCTNLYTYGCDWYDNTIEDFSLNTINHYQTWCSDNGYGDFTSMSTNLEQDGTYQVGLVCGADNHYVSLWIDLDDDKIFAPSEKLVNDLYCEYGWTNYYTNITIPMQSLPGVRVLPFHSNLH